jgi:hypothetical protein
MGDESRPPIALTLHQVLWVIERLEARWQLCHRQGGRREIAAAAVTHLLGWLGWLRSRELFSICWGDLLVTRPSRGLTIGLPPSIDAIELRLLPETKGSRTKVADVVISYVCASGLMPGIWVERLWCEWSPVTPTDRIIWGREGSAWDSQYY